MAENIISSMSVALSLGSQCTLRNRFSSFHSKFSKHLLFLCVCVCVPKTSSVLNIATLNCVGENLRCSVFERIVINIVAVSVVIAAACTGQIPTPSIQCSRWATADPEMKFSSSENHELSKVLSFKPGKEQKKLNMLLILQKGSKIA